MSALRASNAGSRRPRVQANCVARHVATSIAARTGVMSNARAAQP
jgi:hypothetical protein